MMIKTFLPSQILKLMLKELYRHEEQAFFI